MKRVIGFIHKHFFTIVTAIIVAVLSVAMNVVTGVALFSIAYNERGYVSVGGEWILALVLCMLEWYLTIGSAKGFWSSVTSRVGRKF